jgi:hypothetical protein
LKFIEPRLLPAIDNLLGSVGWKDESIRGETGDEDPNEMMDAEGLLVLVLYKQD